MTFCIGLFLWRRAGALPLGGCSSPWRSLPRWPTFRPWNPNAGPCSRRRGVSNALPPRWGVSTNGDTSRSLPSRWPIRPTARSSASCMRRCSMSNATAATFARFGLRSTDDWVATLPESMRDYVQWGWTQAVAETISPSSVDAYLPHNARFEIDGRYTRCLCQSVRLESRELHHRERYAALPGRGAAACRGDPVGGTAAKAAVGKRIRPCGGCGADPRTDAAAVGLSRRTVPDPLRTAFGRASANSVDVINSLSVHSLWLR